MTKRQDRIPYWPAMMARQMAADYCGLSVAEFEREIVAGRLPLPVKFGSRERWHRQSIDEHLDRIVNGPGYDWHAESPIYAGDLRYQRK